MFLAQCLCLRSFTQREMRVNAAPATCRDLTLHLPLCRGDTFTELAHSLEYLQMKGLLIKGGSLGRGDKQRPGSGKSTVI